MKWLISENDHYYLKGGELQIHAIWILLLFTLGFRLFLLSGMAQGDDLQYAAIANRIYQGIRIPGLYIFDLRWFVILPTAAMYKLFGINDFASLFFPTVLSVLSVYMAWAIINDLTDGRTAGITAALYSVFPLVSIYGTFLQVAVFLEFASLLTIRLFVKAVNRNKVSGFLYAGLAASLIPMARMSGVLLFVLLFLYLIYMTVENQKISLDTVKSVLLFFMVFILASLTLLMVQGIVYAVIYNDFFYRLEVSQKAIALQNLTIGMDPKNFWFYVLGFFKNEGFYNNDYFGWFGFLAFPAVLYCLAKGIKKSYVLIAWFLGLLLLMTIAPSSLFPYKLLIRNIRYMTVLILPLVAVCVIAMTDLARNHGKFGKVLFGFLLFILPLASIINDVEISAYYKQIAQEKRQWIEDVLNFSENDNSMVYASDMNFPRWYGYYSGYEKANLRYIKRLKDIKRPGLLFLQKGVHKDRYLLNKTDRNSLWQQIPDDWILVKERNGKQLFKVFPIDSKDFYTSRVKCLNGKPFNLDIQSFHVKNIKNAHFVDQDMAGFGNKWQFNNHLFVGASPAGGEITIELTADTQSKKELTICFTKAPDFGALDVFFNHNRILHEYDLYDKVVTSERKHIGAVMFNSGKNLLRFVILGKQARGRGHRAGIDYIEVK